MRVTGTVVTIKPRFAFLHPDAGRPDLFVGVEEFEKVGVPARLNARFSADVVDKNGRHRAVNLQPIQ